MFCGVSAHAVGALLILMLSASLHLLCMRSLDLRCVMLSDVAQKALKHR